MRLLANTYYQQIFNKHPQFALFGSGYGGTREEGIRILARYASDANTAGVLKAEGVRYVLLHDDVYREEGTEPPAEPPGLTLVARLAGNVRAFVIAPEVVPADLPKLLDLNAATIGAAQTLRAPSLQLSGFSDPVVHRAPGWQRLEGEGTIVLRSSDLRVRRGQLVFETVAEGVPRTLQLVDGSGVVVRQVTVEVTPTNVLLGAFEMPRQTTTFTLRADPAGPIEIGPVSVQPLADFSTSIRDN
jgi:hypothetical protein